MDLSRPRRARVGTALVLVFTGVFSLGAALGQSAGPWHPPAWWPFGGSPAGSVPYRPVELRIPVLGVRAPVEPVGLSPTGAIAAPPLARAHETGWYRDGPAPGQFGAAVIVGHVDDPRGPAVFGELAAIPAGARIEITRADGLVATFEVTGVRAYPKTALPAEEVYGDFREPALRLITCGGRWLGGETGYAENIVVFASLVPGSGG